MCVLILTIKIKISKQSYDINIVKNEKRKFFIETKFGQYSKQLESLVQKNIVKLQPLTRVLCFQYVQISNGGIYFLPNTSKNLRKPVNTSIQHNKIGDEVLGLTVTLMSYLDLVSMSFENTKFFKHYSLLDQFIQTRTDSEVINKLLDTHLFNE